MKRSKAYAPRKMRDNNRPTQTREPNPDKSKRGPQPVAQFRPFKRQRPRHTQPPSAARVGKCGLKLAAQKRQAESWAQHQEFRRRMDAAPNAEKRRYWQERMSRIGLFL